MKKVRKTRKQKIKSAERIRMQKLKVKEILDKKEELKNLKQELKQISRKNTRKRILFMAFQLAPLVVGTYMSRKSFDFKTTAHPIEEIAINDEGYQLTEAGWIENLCDYGNIEQSYVKYTGEWIEVPENSDMVYRIFIDMTNKPKIKDFIDAYETGDIEKMGECLDVGIQTTSKNSELYESEEKSHFELMYQYVNEDQGKEIPLAIGVRALLALLFEALGISVSLLIRSFTPIVLDYSKEDNIGSRIRKLETELEK